MPGARTAPTTPPPARSRVHPGVFWPSVVLIGAFVLFAVVAPTTAESAIGAVQDSIVGSLGWYYTLLVAAFIAFALWVGLGRAGDITLGRDGEEPEFGLRSWFAMLFSAGMGIGLVFWGVAEPLNHYAAPKPGVTGDEVQLAQQAINQTYVHWGLHAWAIYVVVGLGVAYAVHRRGRPVSIRWALEPLLGRRVQGRLGDAVDTAAVVGTVFGVATSLGLGVIQIGAGLDFLGLAESSTTVQVVAIAVITALATLSVVSGVGRGIKWLSNANIGLAAALLVFVLVAGPTLFLLREFVQSIGYYLQDVLRLTFDVTAFQGEAGEAWQASWATFYWGWWISWSPFVGVFIARISRGRTVREFVGGVLLVPTLVTFLWFAVLGGTALHRELFGGGGLVGEDGSVDTESALFGLLDGLPGGPVVVGMTILLVVTFFVTSSDSGSLVVGMLTAGGDPEPPTWLRVLWSCLQGLVAAALLLAGGLVALQTASIVVALPFSLVMVGIAVALVRALRAEHRARLRREDEALRNHVAATVATSLGTAEANGERRAAH
ncbi:BCCT family transporter [Vallicoccus soli]|uniref:BCCT family transporter n=1 Tax=Vallicoccus soli TaxID=2339232 RepID=A0A3A3YWV8_9ACTN|nr:BCCT family transporter [Vallicoccus soli]RJK92455.1 BCCT family transporter [Vallicoccus soli]